ncbi:chromosomal replication initiator protein dnaA 2 [Waddlia chondrophila 2032/99]|uniref:Chromosomal replication initiator protein DnaA n=2 Tax=Waddlia chondrophila TaxID=71667 RepID=D6YU41_WADCW|nr:chromosomal replication initiator protein DnaA [Waddlia chondrophila]ADI37652.1 Chromosomal replication initiator protein dnaA [Waddlia chondrophila WSU 86-1044]CCB90601.1 chromosomal replication initiator protein dnaA 2 [Waddlia chondrophila 2032/99]
MAICTPCDTSDQWTKFLEYIQKQCSATAFGNWFEPIKVLESTSEGISLEIPNIFVKEYLLTNYKKELCAFLPVNSKGEPEIHFVVSRRSAKKAAFEAIPASSSKAEQFKNHDVKLNHNYRFELFIEGPANQFVKSAAMGVAARPGQSYNPLFIHGGVGLGKTHILHSIGHYIHERNKKLRVQCITTEAFINDLVDSLRNKSVDQLKRFYRSQVDVLLVDDIQFLQNRLNFEEEFCNTFETLINQNKQIVITSDKPPSQLNLSERMVARMEWGLVAHLGVPELETRVAILQHKAQQKGLDLPNNVAFFIAEHIYNNVRQLEGAINRLSAHCKLLNLNITEELVETTLREMLHHAPKSKISVEQILKSVAAVFQVRVSDLRGTSRTKEIALPRQVAMYLACKMINGTLQTLSDSFGKAHSTILHACKSIEKKVAENDTLRRQINMVERNINA